MTSITSITRRDIFDLFRCGIIEDFLGEDIYIKYPYYGRVDTLNFLNRIYDLKYLESKDSKYESIEHEVTMHLQNGDDSGCWIFEDERFKLCDGNDSILLKFLCEVFHPEVRDEKKNWMIFLDKINELLRKDGYELFVSGKLSEREFFDWRLYDKK